VLVVKWRRGVRQQSAVGDGLDVSQRLTVVRATVCAGVRDVIVGALYHPPQPLYQTSDLLNHIEVCVNAIASAFPAALVVLAGHFNTLPEDDVVARADRTVLHRRSADTWDEQT